MVTKKGKLTLSVVMANYNKERYIAEAIESVLEQSLKPDEFIIIDDVSTDNSVEIIKNYAKKNSIIKFIRNNENKGLYYTLNFCLREASKDYIAFPGSDDKFLPGCFEKLMNMLSQFPHAGLCTAHEALIDEYGKEIGMQNRPQISKKPCYLSPKKVQSILERKGVFINSTACIVKRKAIIEIGEIREGIGDLLPLTAIASRYGACYIPEKLACWRVMETSYSQKLQYDIAENLKRNDLKLNFIQSEGMRELFPQKFVLNYSKAETYQVGKKVCDIAKSDFDNFLSNIEQVLSRNTAFMSSVFLKGIRLLLRMTWWMTILFLQINYTPFPMILSSIKRKLEKSRELKQIRTET